MIMKNKLIETINEVKIKNLTYGFDMKIGN